ncbi:MULTISPECIES: glutathione S-transferase [unclassified Polynucleobacter]|jgi:glutathione S-transferase|uniref:glutathione S-transferase n=1 Tax=unclassified Polynucleobacter TaxID=2640945 RepID=UPI00092B94E0|nr:MULTISPECIES: glutathione S-transferase [unclassified Polynucleobacter]MBU3564287.1 glutathione S-transferase [Polynucleobacter sp. Tro8-14-1]MBU3641812.1 glutathione S-transferase [Polynucleobacter sp. Fuers-14]MEA9568558.1 glutathione S-transferase [Polynucleobacter sp. AP-Nickl1-40-C4]OJI04346.1 glutathione S-transferase [Polynucleobacter sp. MWH-Adler-W8]
MTPTLYSYRRCPYAMRARMALKYAGIQVEHREIELRNKPQSMLQLSPKGTVPVLRMDNLVIDQSLDILHWALQQSDPHGWKEVDESIANSWIEKNDGPFKTLLDQYKYPNRFPELDPEAVLDEVLQVMLIPMEQVLQNFQYLMGGRLTWVDVAIFPFIRQFSMVDSKRFEQLPIPAVKKWLNQQLESDLFDSVMQKHPTWKD